MTPLTKGQRVMTQWGTGTVEAFEVLNSPSFHGSRPTTDPDGKCRVILALDDRSKWPYDGPYAMRKDITVIA